MSFTYKLLFVLSSFVILGCSYSHEDTSNKQYSRSDCIVKFSIEWSEPSNIERINRSISQLQSFHNDLFVAGYSVANETREYYYIQYAKECKNRIQLTKKVISAWSDEIHPVENYNVFEEKIEPSIYTIDISGSHWAD